MMDGQAFSLVDGAKIKIEGLLETGEYELVSCHSQQVLQLIYQQLDSLEQVAKTTLDTSLDLLIAMEAVELDEMVDVILSKSERNDDDDDGDDGGEEIESLKKRMHSFTGKLKKEMQRCSDGLYNINPTEEEEEHNDGGAISSRVIGVAEVYARLKDNLKRSTVTAITGMPGVGKTTLANKLFHDPEVMQLYDNRVWVRVGKNCRVNDIPRRILEEMDPEGLQTLLWGDKKAINEYLMGSLRSKRSFIVLDDVWDRFAMYLLHPRRRYKMNADPELNHPFLHPDSVCRLLITSRQQQLEENRMSLSIFGDIVAMRLLNREESWDLLCSNLFGKSSSCPAEFVEVGKKISDNCDGLPLTIVTIARLLSKEETSSLEYWSTVAAKKNHQIFLDAYNEISKVLLPSYTYLPPLLQKCFLYIGLFPRNREILRTKLIILWLADGFPEMNININRHNEAIDCLEELLSNNVVMVHKKSAFSYTHTAKICGLHTSFWYLSRQKIKETMFALVLNNPKDCLEENIGAHHRLSFNSNVLFAMKDVHKTVEDNCALNARSLLCFGPYHQYQVPLCFHLKFLTKFDAHSIRFYEFPLEILQLVWLKYLALTLNEMIPPNISQLTNLEFFIVDRHQHIRSHRHQSYLPMEIWGLKKLKHLHVMGSDLPIPNGGFLGCLVSLLNVSAHSCTKRVLERLSELHELNFRIELTPNDGDGKTVDCFAQISCLEKLSKLKCIVINCGVIPRIVPFPSILPLSLKKLSLSGLGYPWKEMRNIATLKYLQVLKLKNYAFQGSRWVVEENEFKELISLVIEDTDLEEWIFGRGAFDRLWSIKMKHCYKLKKIHGDFGTVLGTIELVDCNPLFVKQMEKAKPRPKDNFGSFNVHSSWEDR